LPIVAGVTMSPFTAALIGLTVHLAAYAAEIVRAGIESVRPGQTRAALALGMSRAQVVRRILLPQAIVRMLPAFGSLLSITIKDTAIASVIAVPELMRQSETVAGQSFQPIEVFSFAMLLYFLMLFPVTRGVAGSGVAPVEEVMAKRADAVPINRVPWVAMGRKLKQLAVLPKENNCQNSTEKAAPVGMAIDKNQPAFLQWTRAVEKEIEPQLKKDEARVIDTMK